MLYRLPCAYSQANDYCKTLPDKYVSGGFALSSTTVCQGDLVKVIYEAPGLSQVRYTFDYRGGELPFGNSSSETTYLQPGEFTVLQQAVSGGKPTLACSKITVLATDPISFSVSSCLARRVSLNFFPTPRTSAYSRISINWGDGVVELISLMTDRTHQYTKDGKYTVIVTGGYATITGCKGASNQRSVDVSALLTGNPYFSRVQGINDTSVVLSVEGQAGVYSVLWRGAAGNSLQSNSTVEEGKAFTMTIPVGQTTCFQLRRQNACQQLTQSDIVCTLPISVNALDNLNKITWQAYKGSGVFKAWSATRNGNPVTILNFTDATTSSVNDNAAIVCGRQYCYELSADVGQTHIRSAPVCVRGVNSSSQPIPNPLFVTINPNGQDEAIIETTLPQISLTDQFTINVSRSVMPFDVYSTVATVPRSYSYLDKSIQAAAQPYCYRVALQSACSTTSALSESVCTLWLSGNSSAGIGWSNYSPFGSEGVRTYLLRRYDRNSGQLIDEKPLGRITSFDPDPTNPSSSTYLYQIVAVSQNNRLSFSNVYHFKPRINVLIPTAFTPNGDGDNDVFIFKSSQVRACVILIYDRWGNLIFRSTDQTTGWDGRIGEQDAPAGAYHYQINISSTTDEDQFYQGRLMLVR